MHSESHACACVCVEVCPCLYVELSKKLSIYNSAIVPLPVHTHSSGPHVSEAGGGLFRDRASSEEWLAVFMNKQLHGEGANRWGCTLNREPSVFSLWPEVTGGSSCVYLGWYSGYQHLWCPIEIHRGGAVNLDSGFSCTALASRLCYSFPGPGRGRPWCYIAAGLFGCRTGGVLRASVSPRPVPRHGQCQPIVPVPLIVGVAAPSPGFPQWGAWEPERINLMGRQELLSDSRHLDKELRTSATERRAWGLKMMRSED